MLKIEKFSFTLKKLVCTNEVSIFFSGDMIASVHLADIVASSQKNKSFEIIFWTCDQFISMCKDEFAKFEYYQWILENGQFDNFWFYGLTGDLKQFWFSSTTIDT